MRRREKCACRVGFARLTAGRVVNPKTAASQLRGGIVMGIGMALTEETLFDERRGRIINPSLAEYHVPVNLDVPNIEVMFNNIPDEQAPWARAESGRSVLRGRRRRLPMPFSTRPANAFGTCRSRSISCSKRSSRRLPSSSVAPGKFVVTRNGSPSRSSWQLIRTARVGPSSAIGPMVAH